MPDTCTRNFGCSRKLVLSSKFMELQEALLHSRINASWRENLLAPPKYFAKTPKDRERGSHLRGNFCLKSTLASLYRICVFLWFSKIKCYWYNYSKNSWSWIKFLTQVRQVLHRKEQLLFVTEFLLITNNCGNCRVWFLENGHRERREGERERAGAGLRELRMHRTVYVT